MELFEIAEIMPAPGKKVIDPATKTWLAAEGRTATVDHYWFARFNEGDIIRRPAAEPIPAQPEKTRAGKSSAAKKNEGEA